MQYHGRRPYPVSTRGLTLIEIMVVVVILGLLATLIVANVIGSQASAERTKAEADINGLSNAVKQFRLDQRRYPTKLSELVQKPSDAKKWPPGGYIDKLRPDPWGNPYLYANPGSNFEIRSLGADGQEGGQEENADISSKDL